MGQHFALGAGPVQIMGQHVLPRLYGCRRLCSLSVCPSVCPSRRMKIGSCGLVLVPGEVKFIRIFAGNLPIEGLIVKRPPVASENLANNQP